jgi:hypothetical protein
MCTVVLAFSIYNFPMFTGSYSTFNPADSIPPKAEWAENRRPIEIFDSKFTDWRCRSSVVNKVDKSCFVGLSLSSSIFRPTMSHYRWEKCNGVVILSLTPLILRPRQGNSDYSFFREIKKCKMIFAKKLMTILQIFFRIIFVLHLPFTLVGFLFCLSGVSVCCCFCLLLVASVACWLSCVAVVGC